MTMETFHSLPPNSIDASTQFNSQVSGFVIDTLKQEMDYVITSFGLYTELISNIMNGTTELLLQLAESFDISKLEFVIVLITLYLLFAINKENLLSRKLFKDLRITQGISIHTKWQQDQSSSEIDEIKKRLDKNRYNRMPHLVPELENIYKQLYNRQDMLDQLSYQMDMFCPAVMSQERKLRHLNAAMEQDDMERVIEIRNVGKHVELKLMETNARIHELTTYIKRELSFDS